MMKHLRVAWHESFVQPLPEGHRFPMEKYELLPQQLLYEGTLHEDHFFAPEEVDSETLLRVHHPEYLERLFSLSLSAKEQRNSGFVHNEALIMREKRIVEGTKQCAVEAMEHGVGMNIAGGTHHAYADKAEGFCLLNDQAVAAQMLLEDKLAKRVLIVDLDVHQGNGTARIFQDDPSVFTFSIHGKNNYPLRKERSDLDIELEDGTRDESYLSLLKQNLDKVLADFSPDFIFYQSGVDVLESDKLGRLSLTMNGCRERDRIVFQRVRELGVPLVCSMGGGYSKDVKVIVEAHANTFRLAQEVFY